MFRGPIIPSKGKLDFFLALPKNMSFNLFLDTQGKLSGSYLTGARRNLV